MIVKLKANDADAKIVVDTHELQDARWMSVETIKALVEKDPKVSCCVAALLRCCGGQKSTGHGYMRCRRTASVVCGWVGEVVQLLLRVRAGACVCSRAVLVACKRCARK